MMTFDRFANYIKRHIAEYLPDELIKVAAPKINKVIKDNDTELTGITLSYTDSGMAPNIYLEQPYESYLEGMELDEIMRKLADIFKMASKRMPTDINLSIKYENVKDKVIFLICNKSINLKRLEKLVHKDLGNGLAMTYAIKPTSDTLIHISYEIAENEEYDLDKLHEDAVRNTPVILPATLEPLEVVCERGRGEVNVLETGNSDDSRILILTNTDYHRGSSVLFYDGMLEKIALILDSDYYIIPSSIHEVMIVPDSGYINKLMLTEQLINANGSVVSEEEILGYDILYYDRKSMCLKTLTNNADLCS